MNNETLTILHNLRSIHGNFSAKEIQEEDIQTILHASVRAANASARQSYSIIVVKDKEVMNKLCGYQGSCLLLFCVDFNRIIAAAEHLGHVYKVCNTIDFLTGITDTLLAVQNAVIAAKSLKIDSLLTNGIHRGDISRVYEILDLPKKWCFPVIALVLGYADQESQYYKGRLKNKGIVHFGRYKQLNSEEIEEIVLQYDDAKNHLGLIEDWKSQGFKHYLDWYYQIWIKNFQETQQISKILTDSGFINLK